MTDAGWKKKAEKLRLIILSADLDQSLPTEMARHIEIARSFRKGQIDVEAMQHAMSEIQFTKPWNGLWEPFSDMRGKPQTFCDWMIDATMYQLNNQNWWLARAARKPGRPSKRDIVLLGKVIEILGGDIERDAVSVGTLEDNAIEGIPFMWTWFNQAPLYEVQVSAKNKDIRIVPRGAPESDSYTKMKNSSS